MGSITKKPKAPTIQYITSPIVAPVIADASSESTEAQKTDVEISAEARRKSLLRRSRGRFGTITTSFRGFLNNTRTDGESQQKTLLGE